MSDIDLNASIMNECNFSIRESVSIQMRMHFSIQHISAATLFCKKLKEKESEYNGVFDDELSLECKSYATNAVLSSVCFLEATINELFCDCLDNCLSADSFTTDDKALLSEMWRLGTPRTASYSILGKYQIALSLLRKGIFPKGCSPYQDVNIIVKLRNALTHYEPEWCGDGLDEYGKIGRLLQGKFIESPLFSKTGNPFFPDKALGYGCADWVRRSCINFTDAFYSKIGLTPFYDSIRSKIC